ncbi:MAG: glycerate kinase family protein, partial [Candidatus Dormibacteria bacterium]
LDVLLAAAGGAGRVQQVAVTGPLGRRRLARLGWIGPDHAVVEMAEAAGLRLLGTRRDPLRATSRGAGELILAALDGGARRITVGVGGSASTDGGAGILTALGARLADSSGSPVPPGGGALAAIASVDLSGVDRRLRLTQVEVAVDVRCPLFGRQGAAHVFAAQKGAGAAEVGRLDAGLRHLAALLERAAGLTGLAGHPGAGAAGGAGFALAALGARLTGGAALVCDRVGLDAALSGAALVITGEGRLDEQTAAGKAPAEVAGRARGAGVPCVAVAGSVGGGSELFTAAIALDRLGDDPRRRVRVLLRLAGAGAVATARAARPGRWDQA